ncbi:hypothetical protein OG604_06840 [Streptomyces sp. NBC_01231]|nr:hypothetical protein OG604_06840 [Streptomyces sp. NBC_01231]
MTGSPVDEAGLSGLFDGAGLSRPLTNGGGGGPTAAAVRAAPVRGLAGAVGSCPGRHPSTGRMPTVSNPPVSAAGPRPGRT